MNGWNMQAPPIPAYRGVAGRQVVDLKATTSGPVGWRNPSRGGLGLVFYEKVLLDSLQAVTCRGGLETSKENIHSADIPEVSRALKTRTQDKMVLLNATKQTVRCRSKNRYEACQHDVPAIVREKPVLEALNGAKYNNQTARAVTRRVPAKSTRTVTHLPNSLIFVQSGFIPYRRTD